MIKFLNSNVVKVIEYLMMRSNIFNFLINTNYNQKLKIKKRLLEVLL